MVWVQRAAILGFLAVMLGAFGSHGLKAKLTPKDYEIFQIGVKYQFWHVLALLGTGLLIELKKDSDTHSLNGAAWAFLIGTVIFSGSLYTLVLTQMRWMGAITPIGGVSLIIGWAALAWGATQIKKAG